MTIRPTAYEFFAGGGLAGLGMAGLGMAAGIDTVFANDMDPAKARAFVSNHPHIPFRLGDVWSLTLDDLPGRPDLAWASSPCQDVSLAGARAGLEAGRSGAFWGFWRLMQGLADQGRAPRVIVLENVIGLLTSGQGRDFAAVCTAMAQAGYRVGALEMDTALWLPQSRPRLFVVAIKGAGPEAAGPAAPFHSPRLVAAQARLPQAVRDAWAWWSLPVPPKRNLDLAALLEPDEAADWLDDPQAILALAGPAHRVRIDQAVASGGRQVGAAYRRVRIENGVKVQRLEVRFDGLAGCLRTPAGGSSRQYVVVCDQGRARVRRLTGREAARLMGLPEDYRLPSSESAALKLTGDAVAVPVVRALTEGLLSPALGPRRAAA
ncbi:DNA cytosine methyltransferase [Brevundimonas sp. SORGH_AS_0993]|uniref:DNA cytosine methyltransferase n=1 Tax=Brevundimonas sp. SORGH_AS_0993 TaxID=3041794 RepID=UPI002780D52C|nr:DNA cytosine methyltransferase [Brevundimonas sp. SORGH_AS_0993]MDQ1155105.1 DNA (cytosine-5)-methyltransferase 1 [Brevundimonas sp. SORGH_AS_0993]